LLAERISRGREFAHLQRFARAGLEGSHGDSLGHVICGWFSYRPRDDIHLDAEADQLRCRVNH
jgi:hypothetical protein